MATNGNSQQWQESSAGQQVIATFSEERTLQAINKLLNKVDTLEKAVDNLTTMMGQAPGMVAMLGDMVDEEYKKADAKGINIDQRLKNALDIAEKLTAPATVEKLDHLIRITDMAPGMVAMLGDMVDEGYREADARGVNIDQHLKTTLEMAEKLTAPEMVEKLDGLLNFANQAPGLLAMTTDMVDEAMKEAIENDVDPHAIGSTIGKFAQALSTATKDPPKKIGVFFGVMKAFGDADRQKALGFMMNFLKHLGKNL